MMKILPFTKKYSPMVDPRKKQLISWALYDFGISAFSAIIQTFIFATYFVTRVSADKTLGSAEWGLATGIASVIVAIISPIIGAIADQGGRRKAWLGSLTLLCVIPTAFLWFIKPSPAYALMALILSSIAIIGAEGSVLYYNSTLPDLAKKEDIGRWSGWGWSFGYAGGVLSLIIAFAAFINEPALIPLNPEEDYPIRATFLLAAAWSAFFTLPFFLFIPDLPSNGKSLKNAVVDGFAQLWDTVARIKQYAPLVRFFIANMLYLDGLATIFAFGGIYAASLYEFDERHILLFGIALNISAGIGAFLFAFIDTKIGAKKTIVVSLICLIITSFLTITAPNALTFWIFGVLLGVFVGPVQASSRTYLAKMAPEELRHQLFGFSVLSGKATSFLGPFLLSWLVFTTNSLRIGISVVILFFFTGLLIIYSIPED